MNATAALCPVILAATVHRPLFVVQRHTRDAYICGYWLLTRASGARAPHPGWIGARRALPACEPFAPVTYDGLLEAAIVTAEMMAA